MAGPLDKIIVLDWTQWQMGPVAAAMLAELGAFVIHIENRATGDQGRNLKFPGIEELPEGKAAYFEVNNRGKKGIAIDLMKEEGKKIIYRLVKKADVFLHNFRHGVPEKLKLDYETLSQYNPKLIYAASSGFGSKGPEAMEPAFDLLGIARSGIMTMLGGPETPPLSIAGAIADQMGAVMTAYGIMAAIVARERFGIGQKIETSLLAAMMVLQGLSIGLQLYHKKDDMIGTLKTDRTKARNPLWNHYKCGDGKWLMLAMLQPDRQWSDLCKGLGIEYLEKDPKFDNILTRMENSAELISIMDEKFLTRAAEEWVKTLKAAGDIICTPIQTINDLENDPQVLANNYLINAHHEVIGDVKALGAPVYFSKTPGSVNCTAPEFGQHNEEILMELGGYSWEEISALKEEEVIL